MCQRNQEVKILTWNLFPLKCMIFKVSKTNKHTLLFYLTYGHMIRWCELFSSPSQGVVKIPRNYLVLKCTYGVSEEISLAIGSIKCTWQEKQWLTK